MTVEIKENPDFDRLLTADLNRKLDKASLVIIEDAKNFCPVRTGKLRDSIQELGREIDEIGLVLYVGSDVEYAPFVELGTRRQKPNPFLRKAIDGRGFEATLME